MRQLANPHHHVLTDEQAEDFAAVLKSLADASRLRLVSLLAQHGPMRQVDLAGHMAISQPVVSHHLTKLIAEGFVRRKRAGRSVMFSLSAEALDYVASFLAGGR